MLPPTAYVNHKLLAQFSLELRPASYLEVGTYEGDSLKAVIGHCTPRRLVICDLWNGYRGVRDRNHIVALLQGFPGAVEYLDGDSHRLLPEFGKRNQRAFDMILVDGDHTEAGALADLWDCWPMLSIGGVLLFDDLLHHFHPHMLETFRRFVRSVGADAVAEEHYNLERADGWRDGCGVIRRVQ